MLSEQQLRADYNNAQKEFNSITKLINNASQTNIKQSFDFLKTIDSQKHKRVWTENRENN